MDDSGLMDFPAHGPLFTWWNHQQRTPIAEKLDRILGNFYWFEQFSNAIATYEEPLFFDHASCCIIFQERGPKPIRPFRFNHHLMQHEQFLLLVQDSWSSMEVSGSQMLQINKKLKLLKGKLRELIRSAFSGIENRVRVALADLRAAQRVLLTSPTPELAEAKRKTYLHL
ncbi:PREDICTED: uncharacterized protein LOC104789707 [Camelina sativa]|uniref:Uncharacterized protein LOC104789707 n=1 Tax=Camelina sativa TaxID=90675 RepID=A0ABM0ZC79_CAMSA|nr:PREDICTED: uncharacterized protein LOC104789707 [Camelina sativa]